MRKGALIRLVVAMMAVMAVTLAAQSADDPAPAATATITVTPVPQTPAVQPQAPPPSVQAPVPIQTLPAQLPPQEPSPPLQPSTPPPPPPTPTPRPTQRATPAPTQPSPSTSTPTQTPTPPSTQTSTKTPTPTSQIQTALEALVKTRKYNSTGLGVVIKDLTTGEVVAALNPDAPMNPASVQKLITGTAAFEMLGANYSFSTSVYTDGEFLADSGLITGNLYIKGTGEPLITAERMWLLVQHLRFRGVKKIAGNVVIDNYFFDEVGLGPGYSEDESRSYQALISALPVSYSSFAVYHRPGEKAGSPVHVDVFPKVEGVKLNVTATTVEGTKGRIDVSTALQKGVTVINVRGTMNVNDTPTHANRRMWQSWESFGGSFRAQCAESGIKITGKTVRQRVPDTLIAKEPFYIYPAAENVSGIVRLMFKWSNNFLAEMLFKTMGALRVDEPGTWSKGTATVTAWWERRGLPGKPQIINGSGMGGERTSLGTATPDSAAAPSKNENRVSPAQIVELLAYVYKQKNYYPDFLVALPSAGVDGTLHSRFKRSKLKGLVRAKTGTLNSVKVCTLAGYMFLDDKTYAFAIFCNNVGAGQYDNWNMQEQILELFARPAGFGAEWK